MKILYFEGAGMFEKDVPANQINNARIRTAFHLDDGRAMYLEIFPSSVNKYWSINMRRIANSANVSRLCIVDCLHYITNELPNDDINNHSVYGSQPFAATYEELLRFVNSLGCSFDAVTVAPELGGYSVFPEDRYGPNEPPKYNFGDEFVLDEDLIHRRELVNRAIYELERKELRQDRDRHTNKFVHGPGSVDYPNYSLWVDDKDPGILHLLRHFVGFNRHWTIRVDVGATLEDWLNTMELSELGRSGC